MNQAIDDIEFTIFDTETTGLEPKSGDRIVEIAAIKFKGPKELASFQSLINPDRPISEAAFQVNRITPSMLMGAPGAVEVLPNFLEFIQGSCLCSYNATFDLGFLNNELQLLGKSLPPEIMVVDILAMSRRLLPHLERYALWFVAESLGIKIQQEHRALSDVSLTLVVFKRLKENLKAKGIFDFRNFLELFSVRSDYSSDINSQKMAKIQEAIDLGAKLKIRYLSSSQGSVSQREVVPREIKRDRNRVFLVGFCNLRKEERTFRIDGILSLELIL